MAKPCIVAGCPHLVCTGSRCPQHERNTTQRGYGTSHQQLRAAWAPRVAAGRAHCARCGQPIKPTDVWDLDHRDDRGGYLGPSHRKCNRGRGFLRREASPDCPSPRDDYTPPGGIGGFIP
jgi:hypothetical protein